MEIDQNITLRAATLEDTDWVLEWRNHPSIRKNSFDDSIVDNEEHAQWFRKTLKNENRILLIAEICRKPTAVLRYDVSGSKAGISVYLKPESIGKGLGSQVIMLGSRWIKEHIPSVKEIMAIVKNGNQRSCKAFEKSGYQQNYTALTYRIE